MIKIYVRSLKRVSGNRPLAWEHAPQWGKKSKKQGQTGKISASEASPAVAWGGGKGSPIFSRLSLEWIPQNQVGHLMFITQRYNLLHAMRIARPFPSSKKFHFQNEAKCETFVVEMSFICIIIKTHFHNKGFALSLVLKVKLFGTRKWPI